MANADLSIKVDADLGGTLSKMDQLKAKLNQTKENVELIKAELKDMNQSLANNDKAIAATTKQLKGMSIGSKEAAREAAALKTQLASLTQVNSTLVNGIAKTKNELANETAALKLHSKEVKAAESAGSGMSAGLNKVWGALRNIAYIVPGLGIAGLLGILTGPLVAGFATLIDKIKGVNKELMDMKEFNKKASEDYGKEAANLLILKNAIENEGLSREKRLQAIKNLKKEFPGLFDSLTNEQLLTGKVGDAYNLATKAIIRKARASAAAAELEKIASQKFIILQKSEEEAALANEKIRKAIARRDVVSGGTLGAGGSGINVDKKAVQREIADRFNIRKKASDEERARLNKQQAFLLKIAMEGADQTIELEKVKVERIKKVREKAEKEFKRRPYASAFIDIPTSSEILEELNKVQKGINDALGKKPMIAKIDLQASISNSDAKSPFLIAAEAEAKKVAEFWTETADIISGSVSDSFSQLGESIGNALAGGENSIGSFFGGIGKVLSDSLQALGKSVIKASTLIAGIKKALNAAFAGNPVLGVVAGVGLIALGKFLESKLPKFADGVTNFGGGMAIVGERGPELVRLPKGSDVIPNGRVNWMAASGASVFIPAITLRGQDLVIAFNRASQTISRNG